MIVRVEKTGNYSVIANQAANDPALSLKAKGLFYFLMTKRDEWNISERGLSTVLKEGREAISSALNELEQAGYLKRQQKHGPDGRFIFEAILYEQPWSEIPSVEDPARLNTNIVNTENTTTTVVGRSAPLPPESKKSPEIDTALDYWAERTGIPIHSNVQRNRYAISNLLKRHGPDGLRRLIDGAALAQTDRYAPRIGDFVALQSRLPDLLVWGKQHNQQAQGVKIA